MADLSDLIFRTVLVSEDLYRRLDKLGLIHHRAVGNIVDEGVLKFEGGKMLEGLLSKLDDLKKDVSEVNKSVAEITKRLDELEKRVTNLESEKEVKAPKKRVKAKPKPEKAEKKEKKPKITEREKKILDVFKDGKNHRFIEISKKTGISPKHLGNYLSSLVGKGVLERVEKGLYKMKKV